MEIPEEPAADIDEAAVVSAAERMLRAWRRHGVEYVFSNLGTDHAPLLEAMARLRNQGDADAMPEVVVCPHEFVAMSAAHGYAAVSSDPQVVLVHVDVGTQNLGAAIHNAHRAKVPVFVACGLAPVSEDRYLGARNHFVHYHQNVFDQTGIVREYCRWTEEYRPPADPAEQVVRGLERAQDTPQGPVYLTATREALEARFRPDELGSEREVTIPDPPGPSDESLATLTEVVDAADAPVVITGGSCDPDALTAFAERTGAGIVEHASTRVGFPRDHPNHLGFDPSAVFETTDLLLLAGVDIPWIPKHGEPADDTLVVQVDTEPTKRTFPVWNFRVDYRVAADPSLTFARLAETAAGGPELSEQFVQFTEERQRQQAAILKSHRDANALTPEVATDVLNSALDESTIVVEDAVTSMAAIRNYLSVRPGVGHLSKGGAGLGWAGGAAVGAKLASPDSRVLSIVGDGSYLFTHPAVSAWLSAAADAPTLTVIYNNGGWNAVEKATLSQYPDGVVGTEGLDERTFDPAPNLTAAAKTVESYTNTVATETELRDALGAAIEAVDGGIPAVLDIRLDSASHHS
ncbi:thiamine pyrophosphate-requiring protein [Haloarchaeobius sp. TZWSO28]|uniref:thiamine pyrophosphate-requiring protein n=1 Tax=Haloarchaeobius sp. TZWSO28 TaxID=3446119 RepID=UPI003EC06579